MAVGKTAWNERIKLIAGLLHSAATTCLAVGVIAPLAASVYNSGSIGPVSVASVVVWLLAIGVFHGIAQLMLGRSQA